jgi:hypothetical protein
MQQAGRVLLVGTQDGMLSCDGPWDPGGPWEPGGPGIHWRTEVYING